MTYPALTVTLTTADFDTTIAMLAKKVSKGETNLNFVFNDVGVQNDEVFRDEYRIRATASNLGWSIMCLLNGENCYYADRVQADNIKLYEIINTINNYVVADHDGFIV